MTEKPRTQKQKYELALDRLRAITKAVMLDKAKKVARDTLEELEGER